MSLRSLSDREILTRTLEITRHERRLTLQLIDHLNEIERRRLHFKQGYSSLFDYCTKALGYAESSAVRRIRSARCVLRFPSIRPLLEAGEVTLWSISRIAGHLTPDNCDALLERIQGRTQKEVDEIVAESEPRPRPREMMRPVLVKTPVPAGIVAVDSASRRNATPGDPPLAADKAEAPRARACENNAYRHCGGGDLATPASPPITTEKRTLIQFSAGEAFMESYRRLQALAWHRLPTGASIEETLMLAVDAFVETNDPVRRRERRRQRAVRAPRAPSTKAGPRHIAAATRDEVYARDHGRCSYVGANGRRCEATRGLQIDHVIPVARGGRGTRDNLRLLCAQHNRLEAERLMGVSTRGR